jgi:hypothetical protein
MSSLATPTKPPTNGDAWVSNQAIPCSIRGVGSSNERNDPGRIQLCLAAEPDADQFRVLRRPRDPGRGGHVYRFDQRQRLAALEEDLMDLVDHLWFTLLGRVRIGWLTSSSRGICASDANR